MRFAVQRPKSKFQIMYDIEYNVNLFHEQISSASIWEIVTILLTILKVISIIKLEDILKIVCDLWNLMRMGDVYIWVSKGEKKNQKHEFRRRWVGMG